MVMTPGTQHVTVLIPTTAHDSDMLADCLNGVCEYAHANTHLCLVCNTDVDEDAAKAQQLEHACRRVLRSVTSVYIPQRIGYVAACNFGFHVCTPMAGDVFVILNDDVRITGDVIGNLVKFMTDKDVQLAGPSMKKIGRNGMWGTESDRYSFIEGWCLAVRVNPALIADGLFDPAYTPGYCEDMDLAMRMQMLGYHIGKIDLPIQHLRSRTFGQEREPFWSENRKRLIEKWGLGG